MGWYTHYKIHLNSMIEDFDYDFVDSWCSGQEKFTEIRYMEHDCVVYVVIKYGKCDIERVLSMISDKFYCDGYIAVESTDELEWPDWRELYEE